LGIGKLIEMLTNMSFKLICPSFLYFGLVYNLSSVHMLNIKNWGYERHYSGINIRTWQIHFKEPDINNGWVGSVSDEE